MNSLVFYCMVQILYISGLPIEKGGAVRDKLSQVVDNIIIQDKNGKLNIISNDKDKLHPESRGITQIENVDEENNDISENDRALINAKNAAFESKNQKKDMSNFEYQYQGDSGGPLDNPTAKILVTVIKRSKRYWEPWELNHNVCPPSLCTQNDEKSRPRGTGGSVFYNGDIVLDKESEAIIYANQLQARWTRRKRATMKSSRTWKNGIVPYIFADNIASKSKSVIRKAIKEIENKTCITFRRRKLRDEDYVRFISEPGCWSMVGRVGGEQKVSIGRGCERLGTAIHEISHALGFWHEQARPDRNSYVRILKDNISPRYLPDFNIADKKLVTSRGYPYDYESVMHYSEKAFTNLGNKTIKVIGIGRKLKLKIGQRDELSNIDIAQLRDMYNCNDKEDEKATLCPKGWMKNGRSCYKFEDQKNEQFSGAARHCEDMNSKLLHIDDAKEDSYIKKLAKKKYPNVKVWRTGGRVNNGTFVWYNGPNSKPKPMEFTKWQKGHPAGFSSMALVYNKQKDRVRWQGVWLGSYNQLPEHAYPFICERRARRRCIAGQYADGRDYRGNHSHTIEGITCQTWSSQYPHAHKLLSYPYDRTKDDADGLGDHNYCRNPSGNRKSRPWCFTTKKKYNWQYCDISICSKKLQADATINNKNDNTKKPTGSNKTERNLDTSGRRQNGGTDGQQDGQRDNKNGKEDNKKRNNNKENKNKGNNGSGNNNRRHKTDGSGSKKDSNKGNNKKDTSKRNNRNGKQGRDKTDANDSNGHKERGGKSNKPNHDKGHGRKDNGAESNKIKGSKGSNRRENKTSREQGKDQRGNNKDYKSRKDRQSKQT